MGSHASIARHRDERARVSVLQAERNVHKRKTNADRPEAKGDRRRNIRRVYRPIAKAKAKHGR